MKNKIYTSETVHKKGYPSYLPVRIIDANGVVADGYITDSEKERIIKRAIRTNGLKHQSSFWKRLFGGK